MLNLIALVLSCIPQATPPAVCCLTPGQLYSVAVTSCTTDLIVYMQRPDNPLPTHIEPVWIGGVPNFALPPRTRAGEYVLRFWASGDEGGTEVSQTYTVE